MGIPRNTSLPTSKKETFSTAVDNQSAVEISVLQGERELAADCKPLGTFQLTGIQPAPRGLPKINVTFTVDVNGILTVQATEESSGTTSELEIKDSTKRSDEDIRNMIAEAEEFAQQDQEKKAAISLEIDAEALLYQAQTLLREGDKNAIDPGTALKSKTLSRHYKPRLIVPRRMPSRPRTSRSNSCSTESEEQQHNLSGNNPSARETAPGIRLRQQGYDHTLQYLRVFGGYGHS